MRSSELFAVTQKLLIEIMPSTFFLAQIFQVLKSLGLEYAHLQAGWLNMCGLGLAIHDSSESQRLPRPQTFEHVMSISEIFRSV